MQTIATPKHKPNSKIDNKVLANTSQSYTPKRTPCKPKSKHITTLINDIPTSAPFLNGINDSYVNNLMHFVSANFKKEFDSLQFDTDKDTIYTLVNALQTIVFGNYYFIGFEDESINTTTFFKPIYNFDLSLYQIDVSLIFDMPNRQLKIGMAHLLIRMFSFINKDLLSPKKIDNIYEMDIGIMKEFEADEEDEDEIVCTADNEKDYLSKTNKTLQQIHYYKQFSINVFDNYSPRNKQYKKIKDTIEKGLHLNYLCIHSFCDNEAENEALVFDSMFRGTFDRENPIEKAAIQMDLDYGNQQGVNPPTSYTLYSDNIISFETPKKDIEDLLIISKYFHTFCDFFYNL